MTEAPRTAGGTVGAVFRAIGRFIKRHRKLFIVLIILAVVAVAALVIMGNLNSGAAAAAQLPQTMALQRMDLQQLVAATGTLQSSSTREVTSTLSYEILEVYVAEGDTVQAGDPLARLDTAAIDDNIAAAKKSIAEAVASDALSLSQAERKLQDAINSRDLNYSKNQAAVESAESALSKAQTTLSSAKGNYSTAAGLKKTMEQAKETFLAANPGADEAALNADPAYAAAKDAYANFMALYPTAETDYQNAKTARDNAQTAYDNAVQARDSATRNDGISIENAQDNVDTQRLRDSADTYRTQLEGYEEEKEKCLITAPVAGTVTSLTAAVGQGAGGSAGGMSGTSASAGSALFTIEDTARLEITTSIPEYDVVALSTGLPATITSDAIAGGEWRGHVKSISAKAADTSGNFTVVVEVSSQVGELAIGMSAKVNIITAEEKNVFAVPYDAVTTDAQGQSVIYVMEQTGAQGQAAPGNIPEGLPKDMPEGLPQNMPEGMPENMPEGMSGGPPSFAGGAGQGASQAADAITRRPIVVQTGMETDYYIEIISDELEEGLVVLTDPEGKNVVADVPEPGMGGMMVGMPRGG